MEMRGGMKGFGQKKMRGGKG